MAILLLTGCRHEEFEMPCEMAPAGERVELSFKVAVPSDGTATKAMGINPTIDTDGFYIAVFGGSGYFNEWVKATVQAATANYDGSNNTVYTITASLTVSDSRLRLHFIANCPPSIRTSPPISGSSDTEEYVMSHIRSQLTDTYNDGYWQKVILPNGVRATKNAQGVYVATTATLRQLPNPIIMVRNFARVYLRNVTPNLINETTGESHQLVTIKKFGLAYAPSEGVIAPILSTPYMSSTTGRPITVAEDDETTAVYYENFLMNYQRYPIISQSQSDTLVTAAPFNYGGFSPSDQAYDYYPAEGHSDRGTPLVTDLKTWDNEHPENNVLFVYERTIPSVGKRATRLIIQAERVDQNGVSESDKFYALDIVNTEGVTIPLLRNQTYTVLLKNIESGSGETDISKASQATSATVSGDPDFQNLVNISDGKSSIGTSFTEKFYVQPKEDFVMFRYLPTNIGDETYAANTEGNDLVTIKVGSFDSEHGGFTELTPAQASAQGILAFKTNDAGNEYKVWIVKDQNTNKAISYVRSNNEWVEATAAQIADATIEKWGMIKYQLSESYMDSGRFFTAERSQAIHVIGSYDDRVMSRDVIIKTSPRQSMKVRCLQKYVKGAAGEEEVVRIMMPTGLSRSVFPLEFTIEADNYSLTPNGDIMPVTYGTSTIPNVDTPAFYFVKTIPTETEYKALLTIRDENDITWKYIDCPFKTTVAQNASAVYVDSHFFNNEDANDEFFNYEQRLFTWTGTPNSIYKGGNTTYTFVMDRERDNTNTYPVVWWDPTNALNQSSTAEQSLEKGLSTSNRVLPPIMTITLNGFTPRYQANGTDPVTPGLEHLSGNTYLYYVGTGAPTSDMGNVTLSLVANANSSSGTVTLSTVNILENPDLYVPSTSSTINFQTASFSSVGYTWSNPFYETGDAVSLQFTYQSGVIVPVTIDFTGAVPDGSDSRITSNGNNSYTFTPTAADIAANTQTFTIGLRTIVQNGGLTASLSSDSYNTVTASHAELTGITLNKSSMTLGRVTTETLTASFTPANISPTPVVTWSSSDESVATVSSSGVVTAVSPGTATITARAGSRTATCTVKVQRRIWHAASYSININSSNYNTNSFTTSPQNVVFTNSSGGNRGNGNNRIYYKLMGTRSLSWGSYSYSSGYFTVTAPPSNSYDGSRLIGISITYDDNQYNRPVTYLGDGSTTLTGTKDAWGTTNTSSTNEISGYNTVRVTMSCTSKNEYDDRNRISSLTVYYGYFTWENPE